MRRTSFGVVTAALLLAATGCGGEEPEAPLKVGDDGSAASEPAEEATPTPESEAEKFDDQGHESFAGSSDASTPEEEAVADAWFAYWKIRAKSYGEAKVDPELGTVAAAEAVSDVVRYVAYLKGKKLTTVGDTRIDVRDIQVQGDSATLLACATNKSIDRFKDGTPAEQPVPFFTSKGTLVKRGGEWRVVSVPVEMSEVRC